MAKRKLAQNFDFWMHAKRRLYFWRWTYFSHSRSMFLTWQQSDGRRRRKRGGETEGEALEQSIKGTNSMEEMNEVVVIIAVEFMHVNEELMRRWRRSHQNGNAKRISWFIISLSSQMYSSLHIYCVNRRTFSECMGSFVFASGCVSAVEETLCSSLIDFGDT